jgi:GTP-binding protein YchF
VRVGIIGLKFTGKTTLFNAITGADLPTGQGGVDPHTAVGKVPDPRLDRLFDILRPRRQVEAAIEWVDVPGFEPGGDAEGRREATRFLEHGRKVDALAQVVRCFDGGYGRADPLAELSSLALELAVADLQVVENRLARLAQDRQKRGKVDHPLEPPLMERFQAHLEADRPLRELELTADEAKLVSGFSFLTLKPMIYVLNHEENEPAPAAAVTAGRDLGGEIVTLTAQMEAELAALPPAEAVEFLQELGIAEPALHRMIRATYNALDLISFFTFNEDECRAWPVKKGTLAPQAAGVIHSDLERGFIRAEVCAFADLDHEGDLSRAKAANKMRLEGKSYRVQDGDILTIRFNV